MLVVGVEKGHEERGDGVALEAGVHRSHNDSVGETSDGRAEVEGLKEIWKVGICMGATVIATATAVLRLIGFGFGWLLYRIEILVDGICCGETGPGVLDVATTRMITMTPRIVSFEHEGKNSCHSCDVDVGVGVDVDVGVDESN